MKEKAIDQRNDGMNEKVIDQRNDFMNEKVIDQRNGNVSTNKKLYERAS